MKAGRLRYLWLPVCAVLVLAAGCNPVGRRDARERNNQIVAQAYEKMDAGAFREAARLFREALDAYPTLARPHLDLALILHDHRRDYVRAIYHYERYLELRPATEKADMIRMRVGQARAALVASYGGASEPPEAEEVPAAVVPDAGVQGADGTDETLARAVQEAGHLRQERDQLRVALAEQERGIEEKQIRMQQLEGQVRRLSDALAHAEAVVSAPVAADAVVLPVRENAEPLASGSRVRTYEVRANDSLSVIAHRVYGDATKWRLIQEANREVLGGSETLRIGQILVIPQVVDGR